MVTKENIKAAIKLYHIYAFTSLKKIKEVYAEMQKESFSQTRNFTVYELSRYKYPGLSSPRSSSDYACLLCMSNNSICTKCIYSLEVGDDEDKKYNPCFHPGILDNTFDAIFEAETPEQIFAAFRARAEVIKNILLKHKLATESELIQKQ